MTRHQDGKTAQPKHMRPKGAAPDAPASAGLGAAGALGALNNTLVRGGYGVSGPVVGGVRGGVRGVGGGRG